MRCPCPCTSEVCSENVLLSLQILLRFYRARCPQCTQIPEMTLTSLSLQGDLKAYLRGEHDPPRGPAQTLLLQRMACEIAAGLAALHKLHFLHRWVRPCQS